MGWKIWLLLGCEPGQRCEPPLLSLAVFIYSMPGYKCSIKERMLYSSCKSRLLDTVEQEFCLEIAKKVSPSHPEVTAEPVQGMCRETCCGQITGMSRWQHYPWL